MPHLFRRAAVLLVAALAGGSAVRTCVVEAAPTPFTAALTAARERPTLEAPGGESTYHRPDKLRLRVTRSLPSAPATPGLRPVLAAAPPLLPPAQPHARPDRGPGVRSRPPPLS
jgi:hypothetical protein